MLDIIVTCNIACKNATWAESQEGQLFLQASFSVKTDRTILKEICEKSTNVYSRVNLIVPIKV